jgi:unspecific monooxygenase
MTSAARLGDAALLRAKPPIPSVLARPAMPRRRRSQIEDFLVLRRNLLELWGEPAYTDRILPGRFLGREQLMLNDPAAIRHVLVTNAENYERNASTMRILRPLLGGGLFLATGEAWRHQRRTIAPAMSPRMMPMLARHVMTIANEMVAELGAAFGLIDLLGHMQRLALRVAAHAMFSLEATAFAREMRDKLMDYGLHHTRPDLFDLLLPARLRSPQDRARAQFRGEWTRMMDRIIDMRAALGPPPDQPRDLFDMLAAARDPETGAGFDRAQLRDEVSTMIIAGHETTSTTLFWACYAAAKLPELQGLLAAEVRDIDLAPDGAAQALKRLVHTRAFIDEVLRLYPPAFLIVRVARGPDRIIDHPVAPGTVVSISPWVVHRHRAYWREPERFDPARFLPGAEPPDRYSYLPFGAGPRICVGAQFALTEAVLVLARLVQRFHIDVAGDRGMRPIGRVTTQPDRPVSFILTARRAARAP